MSMRSSRIENVFSYNEVIFCFIIIIDIKWLPNKHPLDIVGCFGLGGDR